MFFVLSKLAFALLRPLNLLILLLVLGLLLGATRWRRFGRRVVVAVAVVFVVVGFTPIAPAGLALLEDRFPQPDVVDPPPDGIIVLGGALDVQVNGVRPGIVALNDAAERMTDIARLARRYPAARIVFTGGTGEIFPGTVTEAAAAKALFLDFGIAPERMTFEDQSRTTWENAVLTRDLVRPEPGRRWLLVTSAFHMPRSMGVFRQAGWTGAVAWPTDYRTRGLQRLRLFGDPAAENFVAAEVVAKELLGLVAYRLSGRSDAFLPAP